MDADNYQAYCAGDEYERYYGEFWETSPMTLEVPHDGFWYLVIDSYPGKIKYWLYGPFD